jgi:steroid delta-isomerase-like uncharacterized protein
MTHSTDGRSLDRSLDGSRQASAPTEPSQEEERNLAATADVLPSWNAHDVEGVLRFYDPQIRWTNNPMAEVYAGHQEVGDYLRSLFAAFPDLVFTVRHRIARGDQVAEEWTMRGTHRGEYLGVPATGRSITIDGMSMVRMRDGRFLRDDFYFDTAGVMRQLGLLPSLAHSRGPVARVLLRLMVRRRAAGALTLTAAALLLASRRAAVRRLS